MSTRWYRLYQRGNPQLRVFLPNFWIKMVRPDHKQPPNIVKFIVSNQMTDHDIKNYLEKIYNVPVGNVRSSIVTGEFKTSRKGYVIKEDDFKQVYITLAEGQTFEFPNIFPEKLKQEEEDEKEKSRKEIAASFKQFSERNKTRPGLPGWFGL
uniref:Large ribosomal subunit protein uL23m n=1 Tax=Clastoptera arizonana TaxID=38151 RepID=A0A1B6C796_9HEMI